VVHQNSPKSIRQLLFARRVTGPRACFLYRVTGTRARPYAGPRACPKSSRRKKKPDRDRPDSQKKARDPNPSKYAGPRACPPDTLIPGGTRASVQIQESPPNPHVQEHEPVTIVHEHQKPEHRATRRKKNQLHQIQEEKGSTCTVPSAVYIRILKVIQVDMIATPEKRESKVRTKATRKEGEPEPARTSRSRSRSEIRTRRKSPNPEWRVAVTSGCGLCRFYLPAKRGHGEGMVDRSSMRLWRWWGMGARERFTCDGGGVTERKGRTVFSSVCVCTSLLLPAVGGRVSYRRPSRREGGVA